MKTIKNLIVSLKSGSIKIRKVSSGLAFVLFILSTQVANAQSGSSTVSLDDKISYSVLAALAVAFLAAAVYILNFAFKVSRENGKSIHLTFPLFKKMANNEKVVGVFILIVVLLGILWAVKFS